jgi:hypothetical protein
VGLEEENVVALGVVQNSPGLTAACAAGFGGQDAVAAYLSDCGGKVGNFEEEHGLVLLRVILGTSAFEANETVARVELSVMAGSFAGKHEAERIAIEFFRVIEIVKIEFVDVRCTLWYYLN